MTQKRKLYCIIAVAQCVKIAEPHHISLHNTTKWMFNIIIRTYFFSLIPFSRPNTNVSVSNAIMQVSSYSRHNGIDLFDKIY